MPDPLARLAEALGAAQRVVCLTGAGISTGSGIPDYRSPGRGVWQNHDPTEAADIIYFRRDPQPFYEAYRALGAALLSARPNPAHLALATLEQQGPLRAVITQNIDSLHQAAGSSRVLELHGHLRTASCLGCGRRQEFRPLLEALAGGGGVPRCQGCGGVIKPDIVFFGEMLPAETWRDAEEEACQADLFCCLGSSLVVEPAASLPRLAVEHGAALAILNREPTPLDGWADYRLAGDLQQTLPALVRAAME